MEREGEGGRRADARKLGERVRAARKEAGLTQAQLARLLGRCQAFVCQAEKGVSLIGERYVALVLDACGLPAEWGAERGVSPLPSVAPRSGWDLRPEEMAGLDPETMVPVAKNSARDEELAGMFKWWGDRREERLAFEAAARGESSI